MKSSSNKIQELLLIINNLLMYNHIGVIRLKHIFQFFPAHVLYQGESPGTVDTLHTHDRLIS